MNRNDDRGRLAGEVMVITGGANGIGRAIVDISLRDGARVVAVDVDEAAMTELLGRVPSEHCIGFVADVTSEDDVLSVFDEVDRRWGGATILVNNAGRNAAFTVDQMTSTEWDHFFDLDLKAAWLCVKHAIPSFRRRGSGSVVNISSVHAHMTAEGNFPYAAAKSGLIGLTRSLALDLGPEGVRVNSVSPGYTTTRLVERYIAENGGEAFEAEIASKHALRRMGSPAEIAEVIVFLASRAASFVTGADWIVDGGMSARYA